MPEETSENLLPTMENEIETTDLLKLLEAKLRQSVLSLEKENYDLKFENNCYKGAITKRKSLLEIQDQINVEFSSTNVLFAFLTKTI